MGIGRLFWRIYTMDMPALFLLALLGTLLFCRLNAMLECRSWWRLLRGCMLVAAVGAVVYITVGQRSSGGEYGINLMPFHSYREVAAGGNPEIYRSNFMNVILFWPLGLLSVTMLPQKWSQGQRLGVTVLAFAALCILIEYVQYRFGLGRSEIDDVIHNSLGALLGGTVGLWIPPLLRIL